MLKMCLQKRNNRNCRYHQFNNSNIPPAIRKDQQKNQTLADFLIPFFPPISSCNATAECHLYDLHLSVLWSAAEPAAAPRAHAVPTCRLPLSGTHRGLLSCPAHPGLQPTCTAAHTLIATGCSPAMLQGKLLEQRHGQAGHQHPCPVLCCSQQPRLTHSAGSAGGTSSTPLLQSQQNLFFMGVANF